MADKKKKEDKKEEESKEEEEKKEEEKKDEEKEESEEDTDSSDDDKDDKEEDDDVEEEEEVEIDDERFEEVISIIEELNVVELAELVKAIEKKFGVSAAAPAAAAGGGAEGGGQSSFDVVITNAGDKKIQVIKAVKSITGKGLKEAKGMVEETPATIGEGLDEDEANEMKEELEDAGAAVELQ